jgi:hypothetical protein
LTEKVVQLIGIFSLILSGSASGQMIIIDVKDAANGEQIPFAIIETSQHAEIFITQLDGKIQIPKFDSIRVYHPFYEDQYLSITATDSIQVLKLTRKGPQPFSDQQKEDGLKTLQLYGANLPQSATNKRYSFDYLSYSDITVSEEKKDHTWETINELYTIEKNRFLLPDKRYSSVVTAHYGDGDTTDIGLIPLNDYSIAQEKEYFDAPNLKYYNPLFKGAEKRYEFIMLDTLSLNNEKILIVHFRPRADRNFLALEGLIYFTGERFEILNGYYIPVGKSTIDFSVAYHHGSTTKNTRFLEKLRFATRLKDIPNFRRKSRIIFNLKNTSPNFDIEDNSQAKWLEMAIFDNKKELRDNDTWMMTQRVDKEKLDYVKKDTTEKKFVLSNTIKRLYYIYDGKLGIRGSFFDLNNVFSINKFEALRLGLGIQSHENLSQWFTFGGYFGYGFKDENFKYGANIGFYLDTKRNNLLSIRLTRDLLEPGLVKYLEKRQDLVRDFFTSRMDDYQSEQISLTSRLNAYMKTSLLLNNYRLRPYYEYIYNPDDQTDIESPQQLNFTETSLLFNIGTPFSDNPNMRKILYRKKLISSNLFLNITKGWVSELGGQFDYWKLNGLLKSEFNIRGGSDIDLVFDAGVMTADQPYQINYGSPGTEFKLTGIIIKNAFQTMQLYGFFTDRYVHSFINYNLGNVFTKNSKFKPELAFAFNLGWGKLKGRKDIHELIAVRDYSEGYYEAGVILNNLLRLKLYKYFYGGLGLGTFIGHGPGAENGAFAIRISYELGAL